MYPPKLNLTRKPLSLSLLFLLTACANMDDLSSSPQMKALSDYRFEQSFQAVEQAWLKQDWWLVYQDPQLNRLMSEALQSAPSLTQAAARLEAAQAAMKGSESALYPNIDFSAASNHTNTEHVQGWHHYNRIALNLNWELDFFGKNREALAAAVSNQKAAAAEQEAAKLALTTQIATQYANLLGLYQLKELAEKIVKVRQSSSDLVALKQRQGIETEAASAQADSAVSAAKAEVIALDNQIKSVQFALAALLGQGPDRGLQIRFAPMSKSLTARKLPASIKSDLLARRPDIVAGRYRAEAASHRMGYAKALFYPSVNLIGFAGFQSLDHANILTANAHAGQFLPTFSLPIFNAGRLNANLKGSKAEYDFAVAQYNETVSRALQEVATAVSSVQAVEKQQHFANQAQRQANQAYQLILTRYKGGLTSYLDVLNAENGLINAQRAVIGLNQQALSADVALIKALGGGYKLHQTADSL